MTWRRDPRKERRRAGEKETEEKQNSLLLHQRSWREQNNLLATHLHKQSPLGFNRNIKDKDFPLIGKLLLIACWLVKRYQLCRPVYDCIFTDVVDYKSQLNKWPYATANDNSATSLYTSRCHALGLPTKCGWAVFRLAKSGKPCFVVRHATPRIPHYLPKLVPEYVRHVPSLVHTPDRIVSFLFELFFGQAIFLVKRSRITLKWTRSQGFIANEV